MCSHLGGEVLNDLNLPKNSNFNGSIHSSRFVDDHPKALIKCLLQDGDESIVGDLSRFMCNHLGGSEVQSTKPTSKTEDSLQDAFDGLSN